MNNRNRAFVLMPFSQPFDSYYSAIFKPALESAGFDVLRADDIYTPRPVMLDIRDSIMASDIILCEMTGRNPNVFYELGLAHAVGKPAILLSTTEEDIPFDLRHIRVIYYEPLLAGWESKLHNAIKKSAIAAISSDTVWPPSLLSYTEDRNNQLIEKSVTGDQKRDPRVINRPINLGFDGSVEFGFPHGWFNSIGYVSNVSANYAVRVVKRDDLKQGRCLMLYKDTAELGEFSSVMQRFPAKYLAEHTVRLQGEIRTQDVKGWAGFWLRADGDLEFNLFFDNMSGNRVSGTSGWTQYVIEGMLPSATAWLNLGVVFNGSGIVWADNINFLVWSEDGKWVGV